MGVKNLGLIFFGTVYVNSMFCHPLGLGTEGQEKGASCVLCFCAGPNEA